MFIRIRRWLGIYDLRVVCADHVRHEFGNACVDDFLQLYDCINLGVPVGLMEAITVIEIVEAVKKEMRAKTLWARLWICLYNKEKEV